MRSLILYTTDHCSLCDVAFEFLASLPQIAGVGLSVVDIAQPGAVNAQTFDSLAPRLPVLALVGGDVRDPNLELSWPFTAAQVEHLVAHLDHG